MLRREILGVPVDSVTCEEAVNRILRACAGDGQEQVVCVNAEAIVEAMRRAPFRSLLRRTALNVPDGIGMRWAVRRTSGGDLPERVSGLDILLALARRRADQLTGIRLFLLGAAEGVAERAAARLRAVHAALEIAGTYAGSPAESEEQAIADRIDVSGATVLLVAYGSPAQDLWIARNLPRLPTVRVAMGVGGAFDFLAGVQRRAPAALQCIGLEWLWRLAREPKKRSRRIWNAVVVFPAMVLRGVARGQR